MLSKRTYFYSWYN